MPYFAHAIFLKKKFPQKNEKLLIHEYIFLIATENEGRLSKLAEKVAKKKETQESGEYVFIGIRKIIRMANSAIKLPKKWMGMEVGESIFEVDSMKDAIGLANGEMIEIKYRKS